jgi:hypothetical protein
MTALAAAIFGWRAAVSRLDREARASKRNRVQQMLDADARWQKSVSIQSARDYSVDANRAALEVLQDRPKEFDESK